MAYARGSASDWMDFLRKLRAFAAGTASFPQSSSGFTAGTQVTGVNVWDILDNGADMPAIPGSGFATDGEFYLQGQGSNVDDEIIVGFRTYRNDGNNLYGIEVRGFSGFDDLLTFQTLPGVSPPAYAAFDDASLDFWFWVNNRRIIAIGRIGTNNVLIHAGFIKQFGSRSQYPYPLLVGGSQSTNTQNFQGGNFGQSCLPDPAKSAAWLKWVDGVWKEVANYAGSDNSRNLAMASGAGYRVWPLRDPTTNILGDSNAKGNEENIFEQYNVNSLLLSPAEVGVYGIFPAVIMSNEQTIGVIDGLFVCTGLGLVAGDTITIGSDVYDVFSNTWRSEVVDYFAVKRE